MPVDRVLVKLEGVRPSNRGWRARCPACNKSALSVCVGDDDRALVKCFRGCETRDVLRTVGLDVRDLFVPGKRKSSKIATATPTGIHDFIERETERARAIRLQRNAYDTPHIRAVDVNVARKAASHRFGRKLAPTKPFAWEGNAPHDSDPLWPLFYRRAIEEVTWAMPSASTVAIEIDASELAASWINAEARHHG